MAGKVLNIKAFIPLKLRSGLTGNYHAICHYSYNLPLETIAAYIIDNEVKCMNQIYMGGQLLLSPRAVSPPRRHLKEQKTKMCNN